MGDLSPNFLKDPKALASSISLGASPGRDNWTEMAPARGRIVIVSDRLLERECLVGSLLKYNPELSAAAVGSLEEFRQLPERSDLRAILLMLGGRKITDQGAREALMNLVAEVGLVPVIVVADSEEPSEILTALDSGARAYVPTSVKIGVVAEVTSLVCAGGMFVPASSLMAMRGVITARRTSDSPLTGNFTPRELRIAEALKKGKANKIIAYELNLCESTVKVHIRNIMKKLKATNRTEVAYKLSEPAA